MGIPRRAQIGAGLSSTSNNIATSQTPTNPGNITLNGSTVVNGVAILDSNVGVGPVTSQRVVIGTAGSEGTNNTIFTIVGTDWNGNAATETITATNTANFQSLYDYATVTAVSVNKGTAGAITVGTNGVGSSRPIFLDTFAPAPTAIQVDVTGTVNATVQQTLDDPNASGGYTACNWINHPDSNLVGLTGNVQGNYAYLPRCTRILLNSGSGSAIITVIQADM